MMKNRIRWRGARTFVIVGILLLAGCAQTPANSRPGAVTVNKSALTVNADSFAVIAFSPGTKKWHMHWDIPNRQQAIEMAIKKCGEDDCRPVLVYGPGVCGTFSLGTNDALGVGAGRTPREAKESALANCYALGRNCKVAQPRCNR